MANANAIIEEHPEYQARLSTLEMYRDLYTGGAEFKKNAWLYLVRRQKEPQEVYRERLDRVFYENYAGSIVDWYSATLFRREPRIVAEGTSTAGREFFSMFLDDCDRRGTNLSQFFRDQLTNALVYGSSYTLVDFPRAKATAQNRAEEDALGMSRAYLKAITPLEMTNWSHDEDGNLNWVVVRTARLTKDCIGDPWTEETRWTYYDKSHFRVYRQCKVDGAQGEVELVDEGLHALASLNRVPLFELKLTESMWLMRKAASVQLEHFNKSNGLSWALTMGLFAMPVVYSDREFRQMMGESYYIQLGPEDKFGWTEPEGHVYELAADNLNRLQREIYRVCYLLSQAGGVLTNGGQSQSGLSKQRDFAITYEVLRALGDAVIDVMRNVLRSIEAVRQDGLTIDVAGLYEFDIGEFSTELEEAERLLSLGIESKTFEEQMQKKLALKFLSDVRAEVKDRIAQEIEASLSEEKPRRK